MIVVLKKQKHVVIKGVGYPLLFFSVFIVKQHVKIVKLSLKLHFSYLSVKFEDGEFFILISVSLLV